MSNDNRNYIKRWSVEVGKFRDKHPQKQYAGTWWWTSGWQDNLMPSFPIFFIDQSSHGYRKGGRGNLRKGPVIKTKKEAVAQAYEAMDAAKAKDKK